jgi:anti-sigma regulatory factor (Ser/Thr protein kinase)
MQATQEKISITADRAVLAEIRSRIRTLCERLDVRPSTVRRVVLATDEAVANVIEHSRLAEGEPIEIRLDIRPEEIVIEVRDSGVVFDPTARKSTLSNGALGRKRGFGLHLIHLVTDELGYSRTDDGVNVLTIRIEAQ